MECTNEQPEGNQFFSEEPYITICPWPNGPLCGFSTLFVMSEEGDVMRHLLATAAIIKLRRLLQPRLGQPWPTVSVRGSVCWLKYQGIGLVTDKAEFWGNNLVLLSLSSIMWGFHLLHHEGRRHSPAKEAIIKAARDDKMTPTATQTTMTDCLCGCEWVVEGQGNHSLGYRRCRILVQRSYAVVINYVGFPPCSS